MVHSGAFFFSLASRVVVEKLYGGLFSIFLLLLLAIVLYGVNLGPGALVAAAEQPIVHLVALLGYLVKILLLLIQFSVLLRSYLARELVDDEILDKVMVKVSIRREKTLILVGECGDCFSFSHSDVHHVIGSSESLDHRCIGSTNLLATYSIPLLP